MKKNKLLCLALACVLLLCGCGGTAEQSKSNTIEGKGFDSPDEAVLAYLDAMREGDVNGMISTFAIETFVDNLDVAEYHEWAGCFNMSSSYPIRADDEYTREILLLRRQTALNDQLMRQYFYLNTRNESFFSGVPIAFTEHSEISDYATADQLFDDLMNPDWMDTLADMTYGKPLTEKQLNSLLIDRFGRSLDSIEKGIEAYTSDSRSAPYGYDDYSVVAIDVHFDGNEYCLFMDVACYDGKWYNFSQGGALATFAGCGTFEYGLVLIED